MTIDVAAWGSLLVGVGGVVAAIMAGVKNRKDSRIGTSAEQRLLLETVSAQLLSALQRVDTVQRGLYARDEYIQLLKDHIYAGKPPPPPEAPVEY